MIVAVTVRLKVSWCAEDLGMPAAGDPLRQQLLDSVAEAVEDAVCIAAEDGFHHDMAELVSLEPFAFDSAFVPETGKDGAA
jgi:hypothetical protein